MVENVRRHRRAPLEPQRSHRGKKFTRKRDVADEIVIDEHYVPRPLGSDFLYDGFNCAVTIAANAGDCAVVAEVAGKRTSPARSYYIGVEERRNVNRPERRRAKPLARKVWRSPVLRLQMPALRVFKEFRPMPFCGANAQRVKYAARTLGIGRNSYAAANYQDSHLAVFASDFLRSR